MRSFMLKITTVSFYFLPFYRFQQITNLWYIVDSKIGCRKG